MISPLMEILTKRPGDHLKIHQNVPAALNQVYADAYCLTAPAGHFNRQKPFRFKVLLQAVFDSPPIRRNLGGSALFQPIHHPIRGTR